MRTTSSSKDILIQEDNEQDLKWDKIQRFPMFDRLRKGMLRLVLDRGNVVPYQVVDVTNQGLQDKKLLLESVLKDDNEKFLRKFRERVDRYISIYLTIDINIIRRSIFAVAFKFYFVSLSLLYNTGWGLKFQKLKFDLRIYL